MSNEESKTDFQMLILIIEFKLTNRAIQLFKQENVPVQYQFQANGTATSEIMAMLGFGNVGKTVFLSMMPKYFALEIMNKLKEDLKIGNSNSGIVFTVPLSSGSSRLIKMIGTINKEKIQIPLINVEKDVRDMFECKYALILVIINQGFSEDVMNAARPSGAAGGTVFHSRRLISEDAMKLWGINVHQQREIVAIVAEEENKMKIMQAIGEKCGVHSEAEGILLSIPVDSVIGLEERRRPNDKV